MSITGSDKGRCEVIADERDVGGMGAVGDVEGAARGGGVDEGRGLDAGKIDVGKIDGVPWAIMPATVPTKLAELSSFKVPVEPKNVPGRCWPIRVRPSNSR
jgi:hypothetical protein